MHLLEFVQQPSNVVWMSLKFFSLQDSCISLNHEAMLKARIEPEKSLSWLPVKSHYQLSPDAPSCKKVWKVISFLELGKTKTMDSVNKEEGRNNHW